MAGLQPRRLALQHRRGWNRLLIHWRFLRYLLGEFRWPIVVLVTLVVGGGVVLRLCYRTEPVGLMKAMHSVFMLIFLNSELEFPDEWYLQPLFFIVPLLGLGALADSTLRLAYLIFTQKQ